MARAVLELVCGGRCGHWFMRWSVDLDRPFDYDEIMAALDRGDLYETSGDYRGDRIVGVEYPSEVDGRWERWLPGNTAAELEDGGRYFRWTFVCPNCKGTNPECRDGNLLGAALEVLRVLHEMQVSAPVTTTVDKLLKLKS